MILGFNMETAYYVGETIYIDFVTDEPKFKLILTDLTTHMTVKEIQRYDFTSENLYYTYQYDTSELYPYHDYQFRLYAIRSDVDDSNIVFIRDWYFSTKDKWDTP